MLTVDNSCKCNCESSEVWKAVVTAEKALVLSNNSLNNEYCHMVVKSSAIAASALPGQFFQLMCKSTQEGQPFFRRPMSLYGVNTESCTVEFLYKIAGLGTKSLASFKPGEYIDIMGPLGKGFYLEPSWKNIVAVGRGAGLATLAPLAGQARREGVKMTVILSARTGGLLVSAEAFRQNGAYVITVTDEDNTGSPENVERILRQYLDSGNCDAFFTCGSNRLTLLLQKLAKEYQISGQAALEEHMACGIGLCHGCVRRFNVNGEVILKRVCVDGPVFDLSEVMQ